MRKALLSVVLTFLGLAPASSEGCGDKFLRVGRGARFQRGYVAVHPAHILLYAQARSPLAAALREIEPALQRAGHKTLMLERPAALPEALRSGRYDLVMADFDEVSSVEQHARVLPVAPAIVPMVKKGKADEAASAEKQFGCFVTSPGKKSDVLAEIDGVMDRLVRDEGLPPSPDGKPRQRQ
jgi:hypothetical protein